MRKLSSDPALAIKEQDGYTKMKLTEDIPYVFLASPGAKHVCPTNAADWSPKHCGMKK